LRPQTSSSPTSWTSARWTLPGRKAIVRAIFPPQPRVPSNVLKAIFTWWHGGTFGAKFHIKRRGVFVGQDEFGNKYYEAKDTSDSYDGRKRRWVIYDGYAEASKVPPDWHGWLHYTFDEPPTVAPLPRKAWEKEHLP